MTIHYVEYTAADQKAFLDEMVQVIEGTHWTRNVLACVHLVFEKDEKGKTRYEEIKIAPMDEWDTGRVVKIPLLAYNDDGSPVTKPTACLVGIILVVQKGGWAHIPLPEVTSNELKAWREAMKDDLVNEDAFIHNLGNEDDFDDGVRQEDPPPWLLGEDQLNNLGHGIIKLLVTELLRLPTLYKLNSTDVTDMQHALTSGSPYSVYRTLESWNDSETTTKALARRLCINTSKHITT